MKINESHLIFSGSLSKRSKTSRLILHHAAASSCTVGQIHSWHLSNGWAGIGYHYFVRKNGSIFRGRPEDTVGAHAGNNNSNSIGICFEGNFDNEAMPAVQQNAGIELVADILSRYGPLNIIRHKDVNSTSCPGKNFPFGIIKSGKSTQSASTATAAASTAQKNNALAKPGSGDNTIKTIQTWLNKNYHAGLTADGIYGPKTKAGLVKGLQTELNKQYNAGLTADGIFGNKTKSACVEIGKNAKGSITYILQAALYFNGCKPGGMDGIFGDKTLSAVKTFQKAKGLTPDGIAGKNTFQKLLK